MAATSEQIDVVNEVTVLNSHRISWAHIFLHSHVHIWLAYFRRVPHHIGHTRKPNITSKSYGGTDRSSALGFRPSEIFPQYYTFLISHTNLVK